jgi:hypothetical protein
MGSQRTVHARKRRGHTHLDWVRPAEHKLQSIYFILVERIRVHDPYVHEPFFEVVCLDKCDTRWELVVQLIQFSIVHS